MAGVAVYTVSNNALDITLDPPTVVCKLCLMDCELSEMYKLWDCRCSFCQPCVQQYLSVMITEGDVLSVTCPDGQCPRIGELKPDEIEALVDEKTYERYKRIRFLREVEHDPRRTFCPEVGCETVCHVWAVAAGQTTPPRPIKCTKCDTVFCCVCKSKWHQNQTCDEAMKSSGLEDEGGIPFHNQEDSDIKRCPLCHVPIERNDGCAQMMCKRCKHVFCWYCLASLDDDFMLRHYDKGPCKNKLGHSRASVVWHRTQVVGIFAGFGMLLLVASPFLLLAAPCILCCKCKSCTCCDDDGDIDMLTSS